MAARSSSIAALTVAAALSVAAPTRAQLLTYHGGPVMTGFTAYTIFWAPAPDFSIPASYQMLVNRWFTDAGASTIFQLIQQYPQNTPPTYPLARPSATASLGGTWVDTTNPYPHAGTVADPILDDDIRAEVARAITANGWPDGGFDVQYFVYTAFGVESCFVSGGGSCTPGISPLGQYYCAYHGYYMDGATPVVYANMPYAATWNCIASSSLTVSPNGDLAADKEIKISSHEQIEAITDPLLNAWTDSNGLEIADKCQFSYAATSPDGRNQTLNGNPYVIQAEWNNFVNGCTFGACTVAPRTGCAKPVVASGALVMKQNADPAKRTLTWPSSKAAVQPLGDPTTGTNYVLCVYDKSAGTPSLAASAFAPFGPNWAAKGTGFTYKDRTAASDGLKSIVLSPKSTGTTKIRLTGKGANLRAPTLPLADDPGVVVQLANDVGGCWEADYPGPAKVNTAAQFKAAAH